PSQGLGFGQGELQSPAGPRLRHGVELSYITAGRPTHEAELVQAHHGIVPQIEIDAGGLLELLQKLRFFLEQIERDLRMQAHRDLLLAPLVPYPLDGALEAASHHLGREHATGSATGGTFGGHGMPKGWSYPLPGHLDQPELRYGQRLGARPI